jgi:hypothetical protein
MKSQAGVLKPMTQEFSFVVQVQKGAAVSVAFPDIMPQWLF